MPHFYVPYVEETAADYDLGSEASIELHPSKYS